jgi:hypothetical protein
MSPPTEQLIRDYLNRLSLAARGRLGAEDRRALVSRTHDFIDRAASPSGPPTSMEVAALLSRLGDPAALVDQEVARLAAARGEPAAAEAAGRQEKPPGRLRRLSAHSSWHWPAAPGSEELRTRLLNGSSEHGDGGADGEAAVPADADWADADRADLDWADAGGGDAGGGDADRRDTNRGDADLSLELPPPIWLPRQPGPDDGFAPPANGRPDPADAARGSRRPDAADAARGSRRPGAGPAATAAGPTPASAADGPAGAAPGRPAWPSAAALSARGQATSAGPDYSRAATLLAAASASASRLLARARRNPVEAAAATLLGLGGAAFPPVWLLGVVPALASRAWDYRDKWIGLAGPVLILVVGTALGITLGTRYDSFGPYVHEGWVYADILSRVGALAGTGYLVWRLSHARRAPTVPPWNKPHRVD